MSIQPLLHFIESSKYILLFLGTIFEGPVIMLSSGFIYRLGGFDLLPMYLVLVSGDFTADIGWYFIGRFGARNLIYKFGHIFGITEQSIKKSEYYFSKYHDKILIISKLTMGLGFALVILMVAGMLKVSFKKYVILNLIGGFIWTALLLTIGYFFGNIYSLISGPEKIVFVLCVLAIFISAFKIINKYLANKTI